MNYLKNLLKKKKLTISLVGALFIIPLILGAVAIITSSAAKKNQPPTAPPVPKTVSDLIGTVARHTVLPPGETPDIATVHDVSKLTDQAFFKDAHNGDKVLIYPQTGEAILYRPSTGTIIRTAPLKIMSPDASRSAETDSGQNATGSAGPALRIKF